MIDDYDDFNEIEMMIFDEEDNEICQKIIEGVMALTEQDRNATNIKIYTDEFFREQWIALFNFNTGIQKHYLYLAVDDALKIITPVEFSHFLAIITAENRNPNVPIYSEES